MNMKDKQTAVEWLFLNLKSHFEHDGDLLEVVQMSYEQAKEMENEQMRLDIEKKWEQYRIITNNEDAWSFKEWLIKQTYEGNK